MSDSIRVDSIVSREPSEYFRGLDRMRFEQFRRDVRPLIDPSKPMLYTASGYDVASFLGSGAERADFVDPIYDDTSKNRRGITPLINWISNIDPDVTAEMNFKQNNPVRAKIEFVFEGGKKRINIIGEDARKYKPNGSIYSVYTSIGHGTPELFLPSCKAQVYVISHLSPGAWGYTDVVKPFITEADGFPVATGYEDLRLSPQEMLVLTDQNTAIRVLESVVTHITRGELDELKGIFSRSVSQEVDINLDSVEDILLKHWEKRFLPLTTLNTYSRGIFIEDMSRYIQTLFGDPDLGSQGKAVEVSLLNAIRKYA